MVVGWEGGFVNGASVGELYGLVRAPLAGRPRRRPIADLGARRRRPAPRPRPSWPGAPGGFPGDFPRPPGRPPLGGRAPSRQSSGIRAARSSAVAVAVAAVAAAAGPQLQQPPPPDRNMVRINRALLFISFARPKPRFCSRKTRRPNGISNAGD